MLHINLEESNIDTLAVEYLKINSEGQESSKENHQTSKEAS